MDKMKERLNSLKEYIGKFSKKTLIIIAAVIAAVIIGAIVLALVLNHKDYVILYTGITDEETTEILGQLGGLGISYTSDGAGNIRVPESEVDSARAQLAQAGYPKSGFTYDVFTKNAGGMTTDMEKQTYKIYELQNRIGATIRLFDGVDDAKVTIALGEENRYVLSDSDDESSKSSASVVVIMKDGGSPTAKQAVGIQRLVARSVPDMEMDNVSVLDGNGIEVSSSDGSSTASADAADEIARIIETQIAKKVINVLEPFYGVGNIRVSAKGKVSLERRLKESTTYETPEKIDENDKKGIVSEETTSVEASGSGVQQAGVVGTETNAEIAQYVADADGNNDGYISETETRDYLVNQIKEQGEIDPGTLEDLTVAVSINGSNLGSLDRNTLLDLVGNATGIVAEERASKITIVNAPFYEEEDEGPDTATFLTIIRNYLPFIIIGLIALILLLVLVLRGRKKKKGEEVLPEDLAEELESEPTDEGIEDLEKLKPEIINLQNERSHELREMVRNFAEENPELSAQMLKNWLRGGDENGGN